MRRGGSNGESRAGEERTDGEERSEGEGRDASEAPTIRPRSATLKNSVTPEPTPPPFVQAISDDLVEDSADSLSLIRPVEDDERDSHGIPLQEFGAIIQTRMTTQKIRIQGVFEDEEETLIELPEDPSEDGATEELTEEDLAGLEATKKPGTKD